MSHIDNLKKKHPLSPVAQSRDFLRILMRHGMPGWMSARFERQFAGKSSISFGAPGEGMTPARRDRISFSVVGPHVAIDCDFTVQDLDRIYRVFIEEAELDEDAEGILRLFAEELAKACEWARNQERTDVHYATECAVVFLTLMLQREGVPIDGRIAGCTLTVPAPDSGGRILVALTNSDWATPIPTIH